MSIVFQPITDIQAGCVVGFECLARFPAAPYRAPDLWFKEAAEVELGTMLELAAIRSALTSLHSLPDTTYIGVNESPSTVIAPEFAELFNGLPLDRIIIEITEHAEVEDHDALSKIIVPMRAQGIRLAIDDAGAGYSGLQHILKLQPDLIKLDLALTRNINVDVARRALASALVTFAEATDCGIIAEGVETADELQTLKNLGVQKAQGYFLGRPSSFDLALCALEYGQNSTIQRTPAECSQRADFLTEKSRQICAIEYGPIMTGPAKPAERVSSTIRQQTNTGSNRVPTVLVRTELYC